MHVVTVDFSIRPARYAEFMQAMRDNARTSLSIEPGCRQFDVCESDVGECRVFLYEVYDTPGDFQAHLQTPHFLQFNALTASWVLDKVVRAFKIELHSTVGKEQRHVG